MNRPRIILALAAGAVAIADEPKATAEPTAIERIKDDPVVRKEVGRWMETIGNAANDAKGFAEEQAPLVVKELVVLGRMQTTANVLIELAMLVVSLQVTRWMARRGRDSEGDEPMWLMAAVIPLGAAFIVVIASMSDVQRFLTAWFAPRIYVIEYLAALLK